MVSWLTFCMASTNVITFLNFGKRFIADVFQKDNYATLGTPKDDEINAGKEAIATRNPNLNNVWTIVDGLKLHV